MKPAGRGFLAALTAFAIWGLFPLYFHPLRQVSSVQVIAHRVVWSCLFVLAWIGIRGEMPTLRATLADRSLVGRLAVSATLISLNWLTYVWGVTHGHVLETSLGYFMGPLVNVVLGVCLLSEKLSPAQWVAVALAVTGVGYLTVMSGSLPWIALTLAFSFATYGLIRKVVKVESLPGLATETLLLAPFAAAYLLWCEFAGIGALRSAAHTVDALLIGSGPVTAIALFLFAYGTRLLPYSTVGVLQYITPTLQFACGVFVLHEPFERTRAVGFTIIWAAILIYMGEGLRLSGRLRERARAGYGRRSSISGRQPAPVELSADLTDIVSSSKEVPMIASFTAIFQRSRQYDDVRPINIYLLRLVYILMFFVLGKTAWTQIFTHQGPWEPNDAIAWCVWAAFATLAGLGIFRPLKMLPILMLEIFYKVLWLAIVAYPLWSTDKLAGSSAESTTFGFLWVILPIVAVPWRYIFLNYIYDWRK